MPVATWGHSANKAVIFTTCTMEVISSSSLTWPRKDKLSFFSLDQLLLYTWTSDVYRNSRGGKNEIWLLADVGSRKLGSFPWLSNLNFLFSKESIKILVGNAVLILVMRQFLQHVWHSTDTQEINKSYSWYYLIPVPFGCLRALRSGDFHYHFLDVSFR